MKKINLRDIICDLYTYMKEGKLIKNGTRYPIEKIIAPLEPELWSYYKGLRGEQSLENHFFHIDKEEKQKKAVAVKPKTLPLDDTVLFAEIAQLWIIVQTLRYDYDSIYDISRFVETILDAFLEHRLNRKIQYQERTVQLVFDELETLEGDTATFYREHTRLLCFFQFYRDDIHQFFALLNNLIANKAYQDSFIRKENIDPTKLLPAEFNAEEARDMLQLFTHRNDRPTSLSEAYNDPSRYYIYKIEAVIWLFNDYFGFEQKEKYPAISEGIFTTSKIDEYKQYFEDALKSLEDKIAEFPALALLLERASRYLTFTDLQYYFPCIHNNEISHDANIYRSLKLNQIKNGAQYTQFEAGYLNVLPDVCFRHDVEDSRPFSNKRMKLLQTMFLGSLWGLLYTQSYIKSDENSEQQKGKELLDILFRSFSPNNSAAEYATGVLNRLIELCCIKTEMFFDTVDFTAVNKSSYFTSNETLLHLYYTVTHFLTEKKYCLLEQLDFTAEMQRRILPIPQKNNKNRKKKIAKENTSDSEENKNERMLAANHNTLKSLDCGFSFPFLWQQVVPFSELPWSDTAYLMRPNFTFRLWFDSVYEDYNPSTQKKYTDEQKYRNLNKSCIENHFFYSADRNMETHFSLHHAVEAVLEKPKRILYALYDIKQYLECIKPQQPEDSLAVPFLQEKLEHIFSTICLVLFPECPSKSWDDVFDSDGIILEDVAITFDLLKDFGKEFYTAVKEFLKIMFTGQSYWMEKYDFELLIYLIYITLHLAKRDADQTDDTPIIFHCTEDEQKRWQKTADSVKTWQSEGYFCSQLRDLLPHSYSVFSYQLSDNIQSRNMKQWKALPVSAIIHLYNGNFEKLPHYLRNMHGIIDDAKQLFELKSIETNHSIIRKSYKKIITDRWNNFARKKLRKTWVDLYKFSPQTSHDTWYDCGYEFFTEDTSQKIVEDTSFKQKVFFLWYYHLKCQISLALSDDGLRIEIFLGVKAKHNIKPVYSITADASWKYLDPLSLFFSKLTQYILVDRTPRRDHFGRITDDEQRSQKLKADGTLKALCEIMLRKFATRFFKDETLTKASCESITIEHLSKQMEDYFSQLMKSEKYRGKFRYECWITIIAQNNEELSRKYQIIVRPSNCPFGTPLGTPPAIHFGIVLSDAGTQMEVYLDCYHKGDDVLFTLPVSAYQQFCDFVYAAHDYVKEKTLTYESPEKEIAAIKDFHCNIIKHCTAVITEEIKQSWKSNQLVINSRWEESNTEYQTDTTFLLGKLSTNLNPNAPEDKFYSFSSNKEWSYRDTSKTGKPEEITVPEKPRCVSYSFKIENKDENTSDDWWDFTIHVDVLLKDNNTELELRLFFDEWDNKTDYTSYTVPLAQYTLLPKFMSALYEYWTLNSNSYYEIEIIAQDEYDGYKYKEQKPRKKEIVKVFTETAQHIFGTNAKIESLTLTPQAFKDRMRALEEPEQRIGSSYSEITEVNGIRQLILSTGIDAVHIQLAIIPNDSLTELEVYFDTKTDPEEKPLFVVNSTDYQLLASFFAELKAHQVEDMFACKKILDEHRKTLK